MRIAALVAFASLLSLALHANTCFYSVDFNKDKLNVPPPTGTGTNNPSGIFGDPIVVRSFGELTNRPLSLRARGGVEFQLARGMPDYTLDFDIEAQDFSAFDYFWINFSLGIFAFAGDGTVWAPDNHGYMLGWSENQAHHVHAAISSYDRFSFGWTIQLDDNEPITGTGYYPGAYPEDVPSIFLELNPISLADTNAQLAIDNIVIGTTTNFAPVNPLYALSEWRGQRPHGILARDSAGNFYGTTTTGGRDGIDAPGTVFKIDAKGDFVWCFSFDGKNGIEPEAGVIIGADRFLYGTTFRGGEYGWGTVFKMSQDGEMVWSLSFDGTNGALPSAELTETLDHAGGSQIYGTTKDGGAFGGGTVFRLDASGNIQILHSFTGGADGDLPLCRLCPGEDGFLYGTTSAGNGTVFKIDPAGNFTTVLAFDGTTGSPLAGLTKCGNAFYGTTFGDGNDNNGTVFRVTSSGVLTILHSFLGIEEGLYPESGLVLGSDGNLYGTTVEGGTGDTIGLGYGTVFRISPSGDFQKLWNFHGGDGALPIGAMIEGGPGRFYGASSGGDFSDGNVYCLSAMKPTVVINSPSAAARPDGNDLEITGKAKGDPPATNVLYQVNGGDWMEAATTNGWLNWTGIATLAPGRNCIRAYAVSAFGDLSKTNTLRFKW